MLAGRQLSDNWLMLQNTCSWTQEAGRRCLSLLVGTDKPSLLARELASTFSEASSGRLCMNVPSLLLLLHKAVHVNNSSKQFWQRTLDGHCIPSCSFSGLCKPGALPNSVQGVESSSQMPVIPKGVNQRCNLQGVLNFHGRTLSAVAPSLPSGKHALQCSSA